MARLELDLFEPEESPLWRGANFDSLELFRRQGDVSDGSPVLPSLIGMTKREAKLALVELGLPWDPQGAGRVVRQDPPPGTRLDQVTVCQLEFSN